MTVTATLTAAAEDVRSPAATLLRTELTAELAALYQTTDGSAGFKPAGVEGPRSAFIIARLDGYPVGCGGALRRSYALLATAFGT